VPGPGTAESLSGRRQGRPAPGRDPNSGRPRPAAAGQRQDRGSGRAAPAAQGQNPPACGQAASQPLSVLFQPVSAPCQPGSL